MTATRLLRQCSGHSHGMPYPDGSDRRLPATNIAAAWTVSSQLADGRHAPAIDLDHPCTLLSDPDGTRYLRIGGDVPAPCTARTLRWLAACGLHPLAAHARPRRVVRHPVGELTATAAALADGFGGSFEQLIDLARRLDPTVPVPVADIAAGGLLLRVDAADVTLLDSSTGGHHHLYIARPVSWRRYTRLLRALVELQVVEPGYFGASYERGSSELRRPGWTKQREQQQRYAAAGARAY